MTSSQDATVGFKDWVDRLEAALASPRPDRIAPLFAGDGYWRDVLLFTWTFQTFSGAAEIGAEMARLAEPLQPTAFQLNPAYPIQRKAWMGRHVVEGMIDFRTEKGPASAIVRLLDEDGGATRAWVVVTHLDELSGFEEQIGARRPRNTPSLSTIAGENWSDRRARTVAYADRDPAVLVVGAGQAGLALAARLGALDIDTLVVDRIARVGDNWRSRYYALTLHNEIVANDLPYLPFPENWPMFIPKDKLGDWFEFYASAMELNVWTSTEFASANWDAERGRWDVTLQRNGKERVLHPRHIVMAVGLNGEPFIPRIDGLDAFEGEVLHSSQYRSNVKYRGKKALVFGTGNSGHDIAQDLSAVAAEVTLVQRSPTVVIDCETAQYPNVVYRNGLPVDLVDKAVMFNPYPIFLEAGRIVTKTFIEHDEALLQDLDGAGFRTWWGEDGTGFLPQFYRKGGGYYFNVGCSNLIIEGKIRMAQTQDIAGFTPHGVRLASGEILEADAIVLATGYRDLQDVVRRKFGDAVADTIGPVWGFDPRGELRNMFRRTAQPGLWFQAGSLPQARCMSKPLALQIKAIEVGLIDDGRKTVRAAVDA